MVGERREIPRKRVERGLPVTRLVETQPAIAASAALARFGIAGHAAIGDPRRCDAAAVERDVNAPITAEMSSSKRFETLKQRNALAGRQFRHDDAATNSPGARSCLR